MTDVEERAWLIEAAGESGGASWYWTVAKKRTWPAWHTTPDPNRALRFARRQDAEAMAEWLREHDPTWLAAVAEHIWTPGPEPKEKTT